MAETTLEDIAVIAGVGVIIVGGTIFIAATVGYSIMTSVSEYLSRKVMESDNMGLWDYFRRGKREITELKERLSATEQEVSQLKQAVTLPVVYSENSKESETMAAEKTADTTVPARLEATVQDLERVKETLLARYKDMPRGEQTADTAFVQAEALRLYAERLYDAHFALVADNMLGALQQHQGKTTQQAQDLEAALQRGDVAAYIRGASAVVTTTLGGVTKATKLQCAMNRDHEGYRAEVDNNIRAIIDQVNQKYLPAK